MHAEPRKLLHVKPRGRAGMDAAMKGTANARPRVVAVAMRRVWGGRGRVEARRWDIVWVVFGSCVEMDSRGKI